MTFEQALAIIITIVVIIFVYWLIKHILFTRIDKMYVIGQFDEALKRINRYYKFLPFSHQKLIVYKTSIAILTDNDEDFLKNINLINLKSHVYAPYYYYYNLAYCINHEDYVKAEKLYGDLTSKYKVDKELDLVTPLAILMSNKGDAKAFKKLKELKRNNRIDITFYAVATRYIRRTKKNDREEN